jgi:hypothetical protein
VLLKPALLGLQGLAAKPEGAQQRSAYRPQVRQPLTILVGFDMRGAANRESAEHR